MTPEDALMCVTSSLTIDPGSFYSSGSSLSLGVGKIYSGVLCPVFNDEDGVFDTYASSALILSHECDLDSTNNRIYNDLAAVCPIIPFDQLVTNGLSRLGRERFRGFLSAIARREVSRVFYLPWGLEPLPMGGIVYLNQICHTPVSIFAGGDVKSVGALTAYGLQCFDHMLTNHFLRPKSERLSFG